MVVSGNGFVLSVWIALLWRSNSWSLSPANLSVAIHVNRCDKYKYGWRIVCVPLFDQLRCSQMKPGLGIDSGLVYCISPIVSVLKVLLSSAQCWQTWPPYRLLLMPSWMSSMVASRVSELFFDRPSPIGSAYIFNTWSRLEFQVYSGKNLWRNLFFCSLSTRAKVTSRFIALSFHHSTQNFAPAHNILKKLLSYRMNVDIA